MFFLNFDLVKFSILLRSNFLNTPGLSFSYRIPGSFQDEIEFFDLEKRDEEMDRE